MKKLPGLAACLLSVLLTLFVFVPSASAVTLTRIGGLDTSGNLYSEWWYTGESPLLQGTSISGEQVSVTVGGTTESVVVDGSGGWVYQTTGLTTGSETAISLTDSQSTYAFTLTIGELDGSSGTSTSTSSGTTTTTLPDSGVGAPTLILAGGAIALVGTSLILRKKAIWNG